MEAAVSGILCSVPNGFPSDEHRSAEDAFAIWLEEAVDHSDGSHETTGELYQSWTAWATKAGEFVGSQKRFSQTLRDRGFEPKRQAGTGRAGFTGVRLIRPDYSDREGW